MIEPLSRLIPCRAVSGTNVEVVRRCLSAIEAGEVEFVVGMLDPNVEVTPSSDLFSGSSSAYRGHAGARRWFAEVSARWSSVRFTPHEFFDLGEHVFVGGTHSAQGADREEEEYGASVWTFQSGLIKNVCAYPSRDEALAAARRIAPQADA